MSYNETIYGIITLVENNQLVAAFYNTNSLISKIYADMKDFSVHAAGLGPDDEEITEEIENLGLVVTGLENACSALLEFDGVEALACLQSAKR